MEIAVYVEGGGNDRNQRAELRLGFDSLFKNQKAKARRKGLSLSFVCCGSRNEAYAAFLNSVAKYETRVSALLVDSEGPISAVPVERTRDKEIRAAHLRQTAGNGVCGQGDGWDLADNLAERVHLMVQCMEAWIVADSDALAGFYHQGFKRNKLPARQNLEEEPKADIELKLAEATKDTQKGGYLKIKHASKLLAKLDGTKVARRCPRFEVFQSWLDQTIGE